MYIPNVCIEIKSESSSQKSNVCPSVRATRDNKPQLPEAMNCCKKHVPQFPNDNVTD